MKRITKQWIHFCVLITPNNITIYWLHFHLIQNEKTLQSGWRFLRGASLQNRAKAPTRPAIRNYCTCTCRTYFADRTWQVALQFWMHDRPVWQTGLRCNTDNRWRCCSSNGFPQTQLRLPRRYWRQTENMSDYQRLSSEHLNLVEKHWRKSKSYHGFSSGLDIVQSTLLCLHWQGNAKFHTNSSKRNKNANLICWEFDIVWSFKSESIMISPQFSSREKRKLETKLHASEVRLQFEIILIR